MSTGNTNLPDALGSHPTSHFSPGIVSASYFASLCGCLLTIEMLHRRGTGLGNLRSWLETLGCATAMGLVGIWCMHFIGNRAIVLGDGRPDIQLVYDSGYTTLSVFLPIIGLTIAFSAAEYSSRSIVFHWISLICTGIFAGLSVVGMHYVGNFGITNYTLTYAHQFLAASIIIAIGDCMLVLILFYTLREKWISSWWKRLLCAMFLAGGVCSMHFTAATGCMYTLRGVNGPHAITSRNTQVTVAGAICFAAGLVVLALIFISRHRSRFLKTRSQKVMVACAMFHPDGRILVTTEGGLPSREITDKYQHRTFNENFDTSHPVFHWLFRVTRHWSGVSELIPRMNSHLTAGGELDVKDSKPASSTSSAQYEPETYSDYSIVFRERFCVAAASLAAALHMPTERIGVLYDKIIDTGTLRPQEKVGRHNENQVDEIADAENGSPGNGFGKGQLLFLTRQLSYEDADKLLNAGYKFGSLYQVGRTIAQPMQIPLAALEKHAAGLKHYVDNLHTLDKPGTWLAFFGLIPRPNTKGFDVGVKREDQDQLPDVQLLPVEPQQWQVEFMQRMDGLRTRSCMTFLTDRSQTDGQRSQQEQQFAMVVLEAIVKLGQLVPGEWVRDARFLARPVFAHYSHSQHRETVSWVYSFCVITDMHTSVEACNYITRIPLNFFSVRQRCYKGSPDHLILAQDIHQEFGPLLARRTNTRQPQSRAKRLSMHIPRAGRRGGRPRASEHLTSRTSSVGRDDGSSEHELVDKPANIHVAEFGRGRTVDPERDNIWGGILVNSETVVKSDSKSDYSHESRQQFGLSMKVAVGTARQEDTFVDELMEATRTRFREPPKSGF